MVLGKPDHEFPRMAHDPPRQVDEGERIAFILLVTHDPPSASSFIAALRLKARIMIPHQAAFSPKSEEGSFPPEGVKKVLTR